MSFNPADKSNNSNNTPTRNSSEQRQQQPPHQQHLYQHPFPQPQQPQQQQQEQQQQQQQPEQHSERRHQEMFEMQYNGFAPGPHMLTKFDGEEELEVIGSGISGSYEPRTPKPKLPMRLPNLNYKYPKASTQNFSPGTSLIFNAYRGGHRGLLTQPYMIEDVDGTLDESDQRARKSLSQEAHAEQQQRQQQPYPPPHESNSYSSYSQPKTLEHQPYRSSLEHSFHPYQANGQSSNPRDYPGSREYRDPTEHESPNIRSSQRSPGSIDPLSQRIEQQSHESRARVPEQHYDPHRSHDDYPPQPSTQPPPPQQHVPSDIGQQQRWESDHGNTNHPYQQPQQRPQMEPSYSTPIDIPQSRRNANYPGEYDRRGSMDHSMRGQHPSYSQQQQQQQHPQHPQHPQQPMGTGSYQSGPRAIGPRYSLSRLHYRMIYDYASEIRECLIKGKAGSTDRLLYNAEILSKVFMGCRSDVDPNAPPEEDVAANTHQVRCTSCYSVKTPEWRKGPLGPRTLCNACGLIWGKMSRNKAAKASKKLESAPKAETSEVTDDAQIIDASPECRSNGDARASQSSNPSTCSDVSRKRGRDIALMSDEDDESFAREEDKKLTDQSNEVSISQGCIGDDEPADRRDMYYQHESSPSSQMNSGATSSENTRQQQHYATIEGADAGQDSRPQTDKKASTGTDPSHTPASTVGERENQDKLALSFLLA